jgi:hypothetical protein
MTALGRFPPTGTRAYRRPLSHLKRYSSGRNYRPGDSPKGYRRGFPYKQDLGATALQSGW